METSVFLTLFHFQKRVVTNTNVPNFHAILSTVKKTIAIPQNYTKPPGLQTPTLQSAHATVKDCIHPRSYETVGFTDLFLKPFVPSRCLLLRPPPCVLRPAGLAGGLLAPV